MRELRRLLGYLGPYRRDLLIAAVMIILETAFEMVIPVLMADIIDVGVANRDVAVILQRGIQMGVCALLALATGLLYARFTARAAYGWGANIREAQFERVQKYAFSNLDKFETSSLVTRMTTDVTVLQNTVNGGYRPLVRSPVMLVMGVGLSFWMNPRLALVFLVCAPVLGGVLFVIVRRVAPMYGRLQKAVDRLNNVVQEGLTAIRAVKAFVRGEYEEEKFQGANSELMETSQRTFRLAVLNLPVFQLVMYTAVVLIMWLGGNMVLNSGLQVGQLTGFLSYVLQVMNSMMLISNVFLLLTRSLASARRISEVLDENIVLDSPEDAVEEVPDGSVEFEGVSFKYHSGAREYALSGVELHIPAGQTVGILGGTGSAKTTLVQLIPRLYDATEGTVRVGGRDVREYTLESLMEQVSMVFQRVYLFQDTIYNNIAMGRPDATREEVMEAAKKARCYDFIMALPKGFDTVIGEGGESLSGGERQRISIARCILKDAPIVILDEATASVDADNESYIQQAISELCKGKTLLVIAHRLNTIRNANQILVIADGRIAQSGTHKELMEAGGLYRDFVTVRQQSQGWNRRANT